MRFLIINPFGIGDCLFTTPVIENLKREFPGCFIGYWCNERVAEMLACDSRIDKIIALSRGDLKKIFKSSFIKGLKSFFALLKELRAHKFEVSFDYSLDQRYPFLCFIAGIKKRIGFNYRGRGRFLTQRLGLTSYAEKHVAQYYLELLRFIGIQPKESGLSFCPSGKFLEESGKILAKFGINSDNLLITIAPGGGASWGLNAKIKHWPAERFAELTERLKKACKAQIVIIGDKTEQGLSQKILGLIKEPGIIDLTGKTSIQELLAIISLSDLLVSNDGGPMHIAVAAGTESVALFGPVDERVYGPFSRSPGHVVVKKNIACRPCYKNFKLPDCNFGRECLNSITTDEVFKEVLNLLGKGGN